MLKPKPVIWESKPNYVFEVRLLESGSYHDVAMGYTSPLVLYVIFVSIISWGIFKILGMHLSIPLLILFLTLGLFVPDVIKWQRLKKLRYSLDEESLQIKNISNAKSQIIKRADILNVYSMKENKQHESIILTFQNPSTKKIDKLKLYNIKIEDKFPQIIANQNI